MRIIVISVVALAIVVCMVDARPRSHKKRHHDDIQEFVQGRDNPCMEMVCPKGSECTFNATLSEPICICIRECKPRSRPVCGSDHRVYDNHCELHRAACLRKTRIAVVRDSICARQTPKLIGGEPEVYEDKPDIDEAEPAEPAKPADDVVTTTKAAVDVVVDAGGVSGEKVDDVADDGVDDNDADDEVQRPDVEGRIQQNEPGIEDDDPEDVGAEGEVVEDEPEEIVDEDDGDDEETQEEPIIEEVPVEVTCTPDDLGEFKKAVLGHYRVQFSNPLDDPVLPELDKKFLVSLMTNHFDSSRDNLLTEDEISSAIERDSIRDLSEHCSLLDILRVHDSTGDGVLDPYEMYDAFDVQRVSIDESLRQLTRIATAGDNLVLVCGIDVLDRSAIVWQRNGIDMVNVELMDGMKTHDDGTLYFNQVTLMHMGVYTCYVKGYRSVKQIYTLTIQVEPTVHTCPNSRFQSLGKTAKVQCYAQGVPEPSKVWSKNGAIIEEGAGVRFEDHNTTLRIENLDYKDTGKYVCTASNDVDEVMSVSSIFIQENTKALDHGPMHVYYFFHANGIRVVEPDSCSYRLNIPPNQLLPKPHGVLCPVDAAGSMDCSWGEAVNVANQYVYASQPMNNRVVVIDIRTQQIIEVIDTDAVPVSLHYIAHLDTLWVVCWRSTDAEDGHRSIQIIKYASQGSVSHTPVHTAPIAHHFDVVERLFVPRIQIPNQGDYRYGYVAHSRQMALTKIDLDTTTLSSTIVLSPYNCHPESLVVIATGGYVVINCAGGEEQTSRQLVMDYLTDTVLRVNDGIRGTPYLSPDGRYLVSADNQHGLIYIQKTTPTGRIKTLFEVSTNLGVSDVGFFPTKTSSHTYDIMVTSRDRPDVLYVDLETSKVKMIAGVYQPISGDSWRWDPHNRRIVNSGVFGPHLATPSADQVLLIDGRKKAVQCEINDLPNSNVIVWVGDCY